MELRWNVIGTSYQFGCVVQFNFQVWVRQFLYHLFAPFSLPFQIYAEGKTMAWNQTFLQTAVMAILTQHLSPFIFWLIIILFLVDAGFSEPDDYSGVEVLAACLVFLSKFPVCLVRDHLSPMLFLSCSLLLIARYVGCLVC